MAREIETDALTDKERVRLLRAADEDEREGRMIRCSTADQVRALMATFADPGS